MENEEYRDIPGFEGRFKVSRTGRIFNAKTGRERKASPRRHGYLGVGIYTNGVVTNVSVHAAVAAAFIGPRPPGYQIDHMDSNPSNNCVENLRYVTPKENTHATMARGRHVYGSKQGQAKLTDAQVIEIRRLAKEHGRWWGALAYGKAIGVGRRQISAAITGQSFKHLPGAISYKDAALAAAGRTK